MTGNQRHMIIWEFRDKTVVFMLKDGGEITFENTTDVWVFPKEEAPPQRLNYDP